MSTTTNLTPCKSCGKEVAKKAKKCPHCGQKLRMGLFAKSMITLAAIIVLGAILTPNPEDVVATLANKSPSDLSPKAKLNAAFTYNSKYTDIQRENLEKEITGQVVQWRLPVYEVNKSRDGVYRIQTDSKYGDVGTFVTLYTQSEQEVNAVESLTTGKMVSFKGVITGTTMRNINIDPAVLVDNINMDPVITLE